MSPDVRVFGDETELAEGVAKALAEQLCEPGPHHLVVTGGGVGTAVLARLGASQRPVDWSQVHIWWGDERFLPPGDPERNETGARDALLDALPIPAANVHPMPADVGQGAEAAAAAYADELARASADGFMPDVGVLLLGMGPEGHVASLFPGSPALHAAAAVTAVHGSPKPPPTRISLTLPSIRAARQVWVVASGSAKAEAVAAGLDPQTSPMDCPAAAARGREGTVFWLDAAAAGG
jgi:6-phosphogluconolactonase